MDNMMIMHDAILHGRENEMLYGRRSRRPEHFGELEYASKTTTPAAHQNNRFVFGIDDLIIFAAVSAITAGIAATSASSAARSAAGANSANFQQDLAYKTWSDKQNAAQDRYKNLLTAATLQDKHKNAWFQQAMNWSSMATQYAAPGQKMYMPQQPAKTPVPTPPPVETYPGYDPKTGKTKTTRAIGSSVLSKY